MVQVTITAALEATKNALNLYGAHNLNRELLRLVEAHKVTSITVHVFSKEGALQAAEFCARNNLQYRIGA